MSGNTQPRRRKDKKKKKDEQIEETTVQPHPLPTPIPNDDTNIHVHKESSLGGGVCAKCVFFLLMIVISIIIGLTITDYHGQTDVEIPESESRFARIFEDWIEKSSDTHEDEHELVRSDEISHEDEENEDDDEEDSQGSDENDEEPASEEAEDDETEESQQEDEEDELEDEEDESEQEKEEEEEESQEVQEDEDDQIESEEEEEDIPAEESEQEELEVPRESEEELPQDEDEDEEKNDIKSEENEDEEEEEETEKPDEKEDSKLKDDEEETDNVIEDENPETSAANSIKKSGSEVESDSENEDTAKISKPKSGAQKTYKFHNITNAYDYLYRDDLDEAQKHLNNNTQLALKLLTKFLENHPDSPRALYGMAHALDLWAERKRSNEILQESIQFYLQVLNAQNVPDALFLIAAERCINRMRFIGNYGRAISVHKKLIERFPEEVKYKNDLAVTYLTTNRIPEARSLLIDILHKFPNNGFALVHYGFILKTVDNNLSNAIDYLRRGIETKEPGVIDGRFYFHLGDALARLGKNNEAMKIYEDGVLNKVFLSKYQRSLYNVERLTARPWWCKEQTPYTKLYKQLEQNYQTIRKEGMAILNKRGYFKDESENLRDVGDWKQFELYARGLKHPENCKKAPITCKIIDSEPDAKSCRRGQVKFSVMHPGTHVWPHCGPTN
ncbi:Tetratricopeptide repeat-containing protein, partial [Oryctes borbonicus]